MGIAETDYNRLFTAMDQQTLEGLIAKLAAQQQQQQQTNGQPDSLSALQKLLGNNNSMLQQQQQQQQLHNQQQQQTLPRLDSLRAMTSSLPGSANLMDYLSQLKSNSQPGNNNSSSPMPSQHDSSSMYPEMIRRLSFFQQQQQPQQSSQMSPVDTGSSSDDKFSVSDEASLRRGLKRSSSSSGEPDKTKARLARNRMTARLRRERKKQEAEVLTKLVAALRLRLKELQAALDKLPKEDLQKARTIIDSFGAPPLACLFCSRTFEERRLLDEHLRLNHTAEIKAREQFLVESKAFGSVDSIKDDPFDPMAPMSAAAMRGDLDPKDDDLGSDNEDGLPLSEMSHEERKRRRLKRNAASARLCRQRKKLYTENLRSQLPGLRHKVRSMEAALPEDVVQKIQAASPLPAFLAEQDPDDILTASRRELSSPGASEVHGMDTLGALPSGQASPCGAARSVDGDSTSSMSGLGSPGRDFSSMRIHEKKPRAGSMDSGSTAGSMSFTTGEATPDSLLSVNIPPLNGWGKPSSRRSGLKNDKKRSPRPPSRTSESPEQQHNQNQQRTAAAMMLQPRAPIKQQPAASPLSAHHNGLQMGGSSLPMAFQQQNHLSSSSNPFSMNSSFLRGESPSSSSSSAAIPFKGDNTNMHAHTLQQHLSSSSLTPLLQSMLAVTKMPSASGSNFGNANNSSAAASGAPPSDPEVMNAAIGLQKLVQQQKLASGSR